MADFADDYNGVNGIWDSDDDSDDDEIFYDPKKDRIIFTCGDEE